MTTTRMTRADVERIVREAREKGKRPNLRDADLHWVDLSEADLSEADLSGADLSGANLSGANLSSANLSEAILSGASLSGADLSGADLHGAELYEANLRWVGLYGANLRWADLYGANLRDVRGVVLLGEVPSGPARMIPLPDGIWKLSVGCWDGTTAELRTLIAGDDWPDATGAEQDRRRPTLAGLADHADNLAAYHHDWLTAVVERWGDKETTR